MPDVYGMPPPPINDSSSIAGKIITDVASLANPVLGRLASAGLLPGARRAQPKNNESNVTVTNINTAELKKSNWKVSIKISDNNPIFYQSGNSGILQALKSTNGVVFPYTPQIQVNHQAMYSPQRFTHSNYTHMAYEGSEVQNIQISGDFTAQNSREATYVLACIYFFRAATKMFFGQSEKAGNPPPLVYLNGYGEHYFPNVPCVITRFSHTMPNDVDYIETDVIDVSLPNGVNSNGQNVGMMQNGRRINPETGLAYNSSAFKNKATRIPTVSQISVDLQPVYSKSRLTEFNLADFAAGRLIDKGFI